MDFWKIEKRLAFINFGKTKGWGLYIVSIVWAYITLIFGWKVIAHLSPNMGTADAEEGLRWSIIALAALVSAPILLWRTWRYDVQTRTDEKRVKNDEKRLRNEQFVEAVKLLGATRDVVGEDGEKKTVPAMELRLGAIYALEKLSKDAPDEYFETVMEILSAYVRDNTRHLRGVELTEENESSTDIKTIFEVLCLRENQERVIDLKGSCINLETFFSDIPVENIKFDGGSIRIEKCNQCKFFRNSFSKTKFYNSKFGLCEFDNLENRQDLHGFVETGFHNVHFDLFKNAWKTNFHGCEFKKCKISHIPSREYLKLCERQFSDSTFDEETIINPPLCTDT